MKKLKLFFAACALLLGVSSASAQGSWTAPEVPGVDLSTWDNSAKVYIYNVGADAFVCAGMNWNTNAVSTRLTNGDDKASSPHSAAVVPSGASLKMILDANTGKAIGTNGGDFDCWIDFDHNQDWTFAASENYANAYTLINTAYAGKKLDVAGLYGGKLTIGGGKGLYDWAFIPVSSVTDGSYLKYKEKKVMYGIYKALVESGKTATYATQLETANAVYVNASATAAELRAAARTLIIAVADGIESRVDVTPLFTNADMVGAASAKDWGSDKGISWGTFEQYHANITLSQTQTDVPNGLYDVLFNGFFRQDGSDAAPVVSATGSSAVNGNVIEMRTMASTWSCNTNGNNNWSSNNGVIPNGQKSAGQALAYEGASTTLSGIPVKSNSLAISTTVNSSSQWFIWQGYRIYYSGAINLATYKKIVTALEEANTLTSSPMEASVKTALSSAISAAEPLSANSEEEALNTALSNLNTAIDNAKISIALYANSILPTINIVKAKDNNETLASTLDGKYNSGTYTAVSEVYTDYYTYKCPTLTFSDNADMTDALLFNAAGNLGTNASVESWTCTNTQAFHINTWSVEGNQGNDPSGMTTPFIENWVASGSLLGDATIAHPTISGLEPGIYQVAGLMRVYSESGNDPSGVSIYANDASKDILANGTQFTYNNMKGVYAQMSVTTRVGDDGVLNVGYTIKNATFNWLSFKNFTLTYLGNKVPDDEVNALLATVPTEPMNATVKSTLDAAVEALNADKSYDNYNALVNAITDAKASVKNYQTIKTALDDADASAETLDGTGKAAYDANEDVVNLKAAYEARTLIELTKEDETAISNAIIAAAKAQTTDGVDMTLAIVNPSFETGNTTGWTYETSNDHGAKLNSNSTYTMTNCDGNYLFNIWSSGNVISQTIDNLPNGVYTLKAYIATDAEKQVQINGNDKNEKITAVDKGTGVLGEVTFTVSNNTAVIGAEGVDKYWYKVDDFRLTLVHVATVDDYKVELNNAIIAASNARKAANEGTGVFQIPVAVGTTFASAISTAQEVHDDGDATISDVTTAISTLNAAVETYEGATLNAPDAEKRYNVVLKYDGWTYDGKAITYIANDRNDMGNYNVKYLAAPNANLAQAITFTQVSGNTYKMSQIDADGNTRYLCTGVPYKGNTGQIRTTTTASDALVVKIIATTTDNVFNIYNTEANNYIGSQDEGVFTVNSHIDFTIAEASQATVDMTISSSVKYATRIFPFAPTTMPDNVVVYSCEASNGNELTLTPVGAPEANVPYIIESNLGSTGSVSGWGTAGATSYTAGWLTGVYEDTAAPVGSYVLQNNNDKVAFYLVAEGKQPTVGANRCYLSIPAAQEGREAFFFPGSVTGINAVNAIEALTSGKAQIFNASGAQIPALQKGLNIIRMEDGTTQKVVVK